MEKEIVVPGMRLCALEEDRYSAGRGTYAMHGYIYASIAGNLRLVSKGGKADEGEGRDKGSGGGGSEMVSVEVHSPHEETVVPAVGDIVTAKVLSVNQRWDRCLWIYDTSWLVKLKSPVYYPNSSNPLLG